MTPIYITSFNAPELCRNLVRQFFQTGHAIRHPLVILDHSDDQNHKVYSALAIEYGIKLFRCENGGASRAKRNIIDHAQKNGHLLVHQLSEDFILEEGHPSVASGMGTFLEDSEAILNRFPDLAFVKWNIHTGHNGDMSYMRRGEQWFGGLQLRCIRSAVLMFAVGSVQYSNWPATWRVDAVKAIWDAADSWTPPSENDKKHVLGSGGEWAASHCGVGRGAVLIANPLRHPERVRHSDSKR